MLDCTSHYPYDICARYNMLSFSHCTCSHETVLVAGCCFTFIFLRGLSKKLAFVCGDLLVLWFDDVHGAVRVVLVWLYYLCVVYVLHPKHTSRTLLYKLVVLVI